MWYIRIGQASFAAYILTLGSNSAIVFSTGLSYGRWAVEAVTIQEFRQYAHYLQPRTKHIMMEVLPLSLRYLFWQSCYCRFQFPGLDAFAGWVLWTGQEVLPVAVACKS